jgi:hypothetical protein
MLPRVIYRIVDTAAYRATHASHPTELMSLIVLRFACSPNGKLMDRIMMHKLSLLFWLFALGAGIATILWFGEGLGLYVGVLLIISAATSFVKLGAYPQVTESPEQRTARLAQGRMQSIARSRTPLEPRIALAFWATMLAVVSVTLFALWR